MASLSASDVEDFRARQFGFYFFKKFGRKIGRLRDRPAVLAGLIGLLKIAPLSAVDIHVASVLGNRL